MSTTIMGLCWPLQMPPSAKAVLVSLADNANDQGVCWPSVVTIMARTCLSERTVQAQLVWLENHGAIKRDIRTGRSTVYVVQPEAYKPPQMSHPRNERTPATYAPQPPQQPHPTPANIAPRTVKEPSVEPSIKTTAPKPAKYDPLAVLESLGVESQVAADWLTLRKKLRADVTDTVIRGAVREADKARVSLNAALEIACLRGWRGIKADWLIQQAPSAPSGQRISHADQTKLAAARAIFGTEIEGANNGQSARIIDITPTVAGYLGG